MSVEYNRPRFYVNLIGGWREGKGEDSAYFPDYSTGVGSFFVSWFPITWLEIQGFGHRSVTYSITIENPYYFDEPASAGRSTSSSATGSLVTGYGLVGPNNYPRAQLVDGEPVKRRDESEQYGGGFSVLLWRPLVLSGRVNRTVVDSNIPGESRAYTRYTAMLSFTGVFQR